ncbi:MAG TPA: phosphatase PAP2 family protein, partial [Propionicimonas sp.]
AVMYVHWRRRSVLLMMLIASAGSLIFTGVGKTVVGRARPPFALAVPPYEYAPSFPSGHTLNATVIALMLAYLAWWLSERRWVRVLCPTLAAVWAVAMGLSRVYLGHHWITDVMFGWFFGLAWLALLITVHRIVLRLERRDRRIAELGGEPDQPPENAIEPDGGPHPPPASSSPTE